MMKNFFTVVRVGLKEGYTPNEIMWLIQALKHISIFLQEHSVIDLIGKRGARQFQVHFPLRVHAVPHLFEIERKSIPHFIIGKNAHVIRALATDDEWTLLLSTGVFCAYERKDVDGIPLLQDGLNVSTVESIVQVVRTEAARLLEGGPQKQYPSLDMGSHLSLQLSSAAISFWIDGELRGSAVAEKGHFEETLFAALTQALFDKRFLLITKEELEKSTIEISRVSRIGLQAPPLAFPEINLAYRFEGPDKAVGWYMPEVFNVREFADSNQFFTTLASEKAGRSLKSGRIEVRVVDSWAHTTGSAPVPLYGPGLRIDPHSLDSVDAMEAIARTLVEWLEVIQRKDGAFPRFINPNTGRNGGLDVDRMGVLLYALTEAQVAFPSLPITEMRERLEGFLYKNTFLLFSSPFALVYVARHFLLKKDPRAKELAIAAAKVIIPGEENQFLYDTHLIWLFNAFPELLKYREHPAVSVSTKAGDDQFIKESNPTLYSEAALSLQDINPSAANRYYQALLASQRADGSFPGEKPSHISYTRGTGKIFEVLACDKDAWVTAAKPALSWLLSMQITPKTEYWIRPEHRERTRWGFRHDALNQNLWVDAVAHILIGCSRRAQTTTK